MLQLGVRRYKHDVRFALKGYFHSIEGICQNNCTGFYRWKRQCEKAATRSVLHLASFSFFLLSSYVNLLYFSLASKINKLLVYMQGLQ